MSLTNRMKAAVDRVQYGIKWLLLSAYGPADQDPSIDPIQKLKREHGRDT